MDGQLIRILRWTISTAIRPLSRTDGDTPAYVAHRDRVFMKQGALPSGISFIPQEYLGREARAAIDKAVSNSGVKVSDPGDDNNNDAPTPVPAPATPHAAAPAQGPIVDENTHVTLMDFYATWCGPCKAFAPTFSAFAAKHPEITTQRVDVDAQSDLTRKFGIRAMPTLVVLEDGKEIAREIPRPGEDLGGYIGAL